MEDGQAPEEQAPEVPETVEPQAPEPQAESPMPSVPGSNDTVQTGEHVAEVQPEAPAPVPATAAPSQDAVSINGHLRTVQDELHAVVTYVENFLKDFPVAEEIASKAKEAIALAENEIK